MEAHLLPNHRSDFCIVGILSLIGNRGGSHVGRVPAMGINAVESAVTVAAGSVEGRTSVFNARDAAKRCRAQG
jgi:hypothetical protein